jgi:hypothetical protein
VSSLTSWLPSSIFHDFFFCHEKRVNRCSISSLVLLFIFYSSAVSSSWHFHSSPSVLLVSRRCCLSPKTFASWMTGTRGSHRADALPLVEESRRQVLLLTLSQCKGDLFWCSSQQAKVVRLLFIQ